MTDELIYLAAPYTHEDPNVVWRRLFDNGVLAAKLLAEGHLVFSPLINSSEIDAIFTNSGTAFDWYTFDLRMLRKCDRLVVLMLDGWRESKGVGLEIAEAERLGMPIEYREV